MKFRLRERRKGATPGYQGPKRRREDREEQRHGARPERHGRLADYLYAHRLALASGLRRMRHSPWATWLTILVVGIALALPTALDLAVDNLGQLADDWRRGADISLFLTPDSDDNAANELAQHLRGDPQIATVRVITREQALEELRQRAGIGEALDLLDENPLPPVVVVSPASNEATHLAALRQRLAQLPKVDLAQMDTQWVERLQAILHLADRLATLLGLLTVVAVAVIVGNTLRLVGQSYTPELRVSRLLGATDADLRRPFLYSGLLYGLAGALVAWVIILLGLAWIAPAVERLASHYPQGLELHGPDRHALLLLALAGPLLGLVTAWVVIGRQIRELENP